MLSVLFRLRYQTGESGSDSGIRCSYVGINEHAKNNKWVRVWERVHDARPLAADLHASLGTALRARICLCAVKMGEQRGPQMATHSSAVAMERVANLAGGGQATGKR
jgi:hypothetical protein